LSGSPATGLRRWGDSGPTQWGTRSEGPALCQDAKLRRCHDPVASELHIAPPANARAVVIPTGAEGSAVAFGAFRLHLQSALVGQLGCQEVPAQDRKPSNARETTAFLSRALFLNHVHFVTVSDSFPSSTAAPPAHSSKSRNSASTRFKSESHANMIRAAPPINV